MKEISKEIGWRQGGMEMWRQVLIRENEMRTSPETQSLFAMAELRSDTDWMEVVEELQREVLRTVAKVPEHEMSEALTGLRRAPYDYPELKSIPLYHRYQRSRRGLYLPGSILPPLTLEDIEGRPVPLISPLRAPGLHSPPLTIIVAGSYS